MEPMPEEILRWRVLKSERIAGDLSQVANLAVALVDRHGTYSVLDLFCPDGRPWEAENGIHGITNWGDADRKYAMRVVTRDRMRELDYNRELTFANVVNIRWSHLPVTGRDEFTIWARSVAGKARDFKEFYASENRAVARQIEMWLTRYSAEHTHPDLRK